MRHNISVEFTELNYKAAIELDDKLSPKTVQAIIQHLPIRVNVNRWGDELYTDATPVVVGEESARTEVALFDVTYWPEGRALCFFYGSTPISKGKKILAYSPVNVIGTLKSRPDDIPTFLDEVEKKHAHLPIIIS